MSHDPMCNPRSRDYRGNYVPCECALIARVREDERQRCREAVAAVEEEYVGDKYEQGRTALRVALAAIDALLEKP